jgi:vacuolar-type H+-ATPase subunit I/STV1
MVRGFTESDSSKVTLMLPQLLRALLFLILVTGAVGIAQAQDRRPPRPAQREQTDPVSVNKGRNESDPMIGSPQAEMMERHKIRSEQKAYEENLDRAREAAQLSTEIRDSYLHNRTFGRTEQKKLERLEKVTRKIRSEAGGSDGDVVLENVPSHIEPALARLAELTDKMRKVVEKTPRQVVSAAVIERANELLEIIRYIRGYTRSASASSDNAN